MLNRDFAKTSSSIGLGALQNAVIKPNEPNYGELLAQGYKNYTDAQNKQAYIDALASGDQDTINSAWANYDPDGYAKYKSGLTGSDGYGSTPIGLALAINQNPDKFTVDAQKWSTSYLANNDPDSIYTSAYNKELGKKEAQNLTTYKENSRQLANQINTIDDTITYINSAPNELFTPLSSAYNTVGTITRDNFGIDGFGFNKNQQGMYGTAETLLKSVGQDLLQEARAKGQTGINTMIEIEEAMRGLSMSKGKPAVLGALNTLKSIKQKLDTMPNVATPVPQQGLGAFVTQQDKNNDPLGLR